MKRLVICICILAVSCDYFEKKKIKTQDIVTQELENIEWNAVDQYPTFSVCDSVSEKQELKYCFENTVLNHVNSYLWEQTIIVSEDVEDTIVMKLGIDNQGKISVLNIKIQPETLEAIPQLDTLLQNSIATLPKIFPAIKRGQQVHTEFVLPIVVSIN